MAGTARAWPPSTVCVRLPGLGVRGHSAMPAPRRGHPMSRRDRIGLIILLALFLAFALMLVWTLRGRAKPTVGFEDNAWVKQRVINQKSW